MIPSNTELCKMVCTYSRILQFVQKVASKPDLYCVLPVALPIFHFGGLHLTAFYIFFYLIFASNLHCNVRHFSILNFNL